MELKLTEFPEATLVMVMFAFWALTLLAGILASLV